MSSSGLTGVFKCFCKVSFFILKGKFLLFNSPVNEIQDLTVSFCLEKEFILWEEQKIMNVSELLIHRKSPVFLLFNYSPRLDSIFSYFLIDYKHKVNKLETLRGGGKMEIKQKVHREKYPKSLNFSDMRM